MIQSLGETDISVNLLVQVDKLVRLLETPIFAYLRLQVNLLNFLVINPFVAARVLVLVCNSEPLLTETRFVGT